MTNGNGKPPMGGGLQSDEKRFGEPSQLEYTPGSSTLEEFPVDVARELAKAFVRDLEHGPELILEHFPSARLDEPVETRKWLEKNPPLLHTVLGLDPYSAAQPRGYLTLSDLGEFLSDVTWLWEPWLPRGFLTLLAGQPGVGKSTLALIMAHCIVSDRRWPDGQESPDPGKIVWVETESSMALNYSRAQSFEIPLEKIIIPGEDKEAGVTNLRLDIPEDWNKLEKAVQIEGVELVIVDSLRGAFRGDENSSECAGFLGRLAELARDYNCGLILL